MAYDYNTGKLLLPGQQQSQYNTQTGQRIGAPSTLGYNPPATTFNGADLAKPIPQLPQPINETQHQNALGAAVGTYANLPEPTPPAPPAPATNDRQGLIARLQDLITQQGSKGTVTNQLNDQFGVNDKQQATVDIANTIRATSKSYRDQANAIRGKSGSTLEGGINAELSHLDVQKNNDLANLSIQQEAANGNYQVANDIVQRKLNAQFEPIDNQIKSLQNLYQLQESDMSDSEKLKAQAQIQQQKDARDHLYTAQSDVYKQAVTNGAPASILDAIGKARTPQDVFLAAGKYASEAKYTSVQSYDPVTGMPIFNGFNSRTGTFTNNGSGMSGSTPAVANNNPGNLKNPDGSWQTFSNPQQGFDALKKDLMAKMTGATTTGLTANSTILDFASKYAPAGDHNDPSQYAQNLATQLGVPITTPIGQLKGRVDEFAHAIAQNEDKTSAAALKPSYEQYGLLANTSFNPSNATDKNAFNYLTAYMNNGTVPTASAVGITSRGQGANIQFNNASQRARDLYFKATGQPLPSPEIIKSNMALISGNNKLANNLNVQESTVKANFGLNLENLTKNNINSAIPFLNNAINALNIGLGDPATAQYILQNSTIQTEAGNLLAVKNAAGTTVFDKMTAAGLIPKNASKEQQVAIMKTLLQEAGNAAEAIKNANADLYNQIDPLQINPSNPARQNKGKVGTGISQNYRSKYNY